MVKIARILGAVVSVSATVVATATAALPASAATYPYDGQNPSATVCANDARTVYSTRSTDGTVLELRYSNTCHTAWARLSNSHGPIPASYAGWGAQIRRNNDGKAYGCDVPSGGTSCFTAMVYDKDPLSSYAWAQGDDASAGRYVTIRTASY